MSAPSARAANFYAIEGVKVDVTAENALSARNQAFEKAQTEAFVALSSRLVTAAGTPVSAAPPDAATISTMIQDYEITQEKLSSVRYIATYTFRFRARAVERYFGSGVRYAEPSAAPIGSTVAAGIAQAKDPAAEPSSSKTPSAVRPSLLILPFYEAGGRTILWSAENPWLQAWNRASGLSGGPVPLAVPMGDLADVRDIGDEQALTYNSATLVAMAKRYGASEALILVAEPYTSLTRHGAGANKAIDGLRIHLYMTDGSRPTYAGQIEIRSPPEHSRMAVFDEAVRRAHAALQNPNWKHILHASTPESGTILVHMPVSGLREWTETKKSLAAIGGIESVILKSLSPRDAYIEIRFHGPESRLAQMLGQAGLRLEASGAATAGASRLYELRHHRDIRDNYINRF